MKKTLSKNLKVAMIVLFAAALFVSVNYCIWDNANANEANDGKIIKGHHIGSDKYEFVKGVNLPDFAIDNAGGNPNTCIKSGDQYYLDWYDCRLYKRSLIWDNTNHGHKTFIDNEGEHNYIDHNWTKDDLWYGGSGEEGSHKYRFMDIRFAFGEKVVGCDNDAEDCIVMSFGKDDDDSAGIFKTQHFEVYFDMECLTEGNQVVHLKTWDTFKDYNNSKHNTELLERAGHSDKYGNTFNEALEIVGADCMYQALLDGKIRITVDRIVCEQDC